MRKNNICFIAIDFAALKMCRAEITFKSSHKIEMVPFSFILKKANMKATNIMNLQNLLFPTNSVLVNASENAPSDVFS